MATSGDYRNYFEEDGVRYCHLIDPRTDARSVTVWPRSRLLPTLVRWPTPGHGLLVAGPDEGYAFAVREGLAAYSS